jgi:hypothetical protein
MVADGLPAVGGTGFPWPPTATGYLALPAARRLNRLPSGVECATSLAANCKPADRRNEPAASP